MLYNMSLLVIWVFFNKVRVNVFIDSLFIWLCRVFIVACGIFVVSWEILHCGTDSSCSAQMLPAVAHGLS